MSKPIVYSETTETVRKLAIKMLEVALGHCELVNHSVVGPTEFRGIMFYQVKGSVIVGRAKKGFYAEINIRKKQLKSAKLDSDSINYIYVYNDDVADPATLIYIVRYHSPENIKIAKRIGSSNSWIVGSSANDRWSEPLHDGSDIGLCYYI